jgi:hypothetical protein
LLRSMQWARDRADGAVGGCVRSEPCDYSRGRRGHSRWRDLGSVGSHVIAAVQAIAHWFCGDHRGCCVEVVKEVRFNIS